MCESCLYKIFQQGYAPCPECGTLLRRINFITSTFEDIEVERELKMRKLMNRHFMREEREFSDEVGYNNYLEEYENVLFELLECKNENMAKERIGQIKNTNSILVPTGIVEDAAQDHDTAKKLKVTESWYVYRSEAQRQFIIDEAAIIPKDFITPFSPAGLKKNEILDFITYSLIEINK